MVSVCSHFSTAQKWSRDSVWYVWNVFPPVGFFKKIDLHFLNFILLGCAHMHLSVCEHLQSSQADFLVSVSFFFPLHGLRAPGLLSKCLYLMSHLLGPLPVFWSDIDSSLLTLGCSLKDPIYVIVTFNNGSLVVYAWEERCQQLNGCYQLQSRRRLPQQR